MKLFLAFSVIFFVLDAALGEACGSCNDEAGSRCFTTKAKRDARCPGKRVVDGVVQKKGV